MTYCLHAEQRYAGSSVSMSRKRDPDLIPIAEARSLRSHDRQSARGDGARRDVALISCAGRSDRLHLRPRSGAGKRRLTGPG